MLSELVRQVKPVELIPITEGEVRALFPVIGRDPIADIKNEIPFTYTEEELAQMEVDRNQPTPEERVKELEEERRKTKNPAAVPEGTANREMCTFLILNISSLQLIPVNIIAYRSQYGSVHPTAIVGPALAATAASTIAAVVFCKVMERMGR